MRDGCEPVARRCANALIPDAEPSDAVTWFSRGTVVRTVERFRRRHGGLWVGGVVALYPDRLEFRPNALNRRAHTTDTSWSVPLDRVAAVADRSGWLTRIVEVRLDDGSMHSFRCFRARSFAARIRAALARGQPGAGGGPSPPAHRR